MQRHENLGKYFSYFNNVNALNKSMKRAEILSEAGIVKGKERLVSLLFISHSLY